MSEDWTAVRIKRARLDQINRVLKSKIAKDSGVTNAADFVEKAVDDLLDKFELKRFQHFNLHDDTIRVLDNGIGPRGDIVELRKKGDTLNCGYCELSDCVHVKFVWSDFELVPVLKKAGLHSPF